MTLNICDQFGQPRIRKKKLFRTVPLIFTAPTIRWLNVMVEWMARQSHDLALRVRSLIAPSPMMHIGRLSHYEIN